MTLFSQEKTDKNTFHFFSAARLGAAMLIGVIAVAGFSFFRGMSAFAKECGDIRQSVLRLHILANSDSDEDQALKLMVRDRILELDSELFGKTEQAGALDQAEESVREKLDEIEQAAEEEVRRRGYDYPVHAELVNMYFSTREYDDFVMPAGRYDALRITIGEGKGHNWWCVLYPPLCLPAAENQQGLEELLTEEQAKIVFGQEKYRFRFAAVELWESIRQHLFDVS